MFLWAFYLISCLFVIMEVKVLAIFIYLFVLISTALSKIFHLCQGTQIYE